MSLPYLRINRLNEMKNWIKVLFHLKRPPYERELNSEVAGKCLVEELSNAKLPDETFHGVYENE